jgi:hypothetical protein
MPVEAQWSNSMSGREIQVEANLLSAFALMIVQRVGCGSPDVASDYLALFLKPFQRSKAAEDLRGPEGLRPRWSVALHGITDLSQTSRNSKKSN